jgi:hypothetical protein
MKFHVNASIMKQIALAVALVAGVCGCGSGGAVDLGSVGDHIPAAKYLPNHFAGLPAGAHPSSSPTGRVVITMGLYRDLRPSPTITEWTIYSDGLLIWQKWTGRGDPLGLGDPLIIPKGASARDISYVQQRLTRRGVQLLRSRMLATGLFQHDLRLVHPSYEKYSDSNDYQVRSHGRMIEVEVIAPSDDRHAPHETKPQAHALAPLTNLLAPSKSSLPASAWADPTIRPYIPTHYTIVHDRYPPDLSRLPPPAEAALAKYTRFLRKSCQTITTSEAQALLRAFQQAGIAPAENHAGHIFYDFAGMHMLPGGLILEPDLPGPGC